MILAQVGKGARQKIRTVSYRRKKYNIEIEETDNTTDAGYRSEKHKTWTTHSKVKKRPKINHSYF